jgi:hypothetical protein
MRQFPDVRRTDRRPATDLVGAQSVSSAEQVCVR